MRKSISFKIEEKNFKFKLTAYLAKQPRFCLLDSNEASNSENEIIAGVGRVEELKINTDPFAALANFHGNKKDWLFGFLSYDLKNEIEQLHSRHFDGIEFPNISFFQPRYVFFLKGNIFSIQFLPAMDSEQTAIALFEEIRAYVIPAETGTKSNRIQERVPRSKYLENVSAILNHIHKGDIYEMNYCIEFFSEQVIANPASTFIKLNNAIKPPFSAFLNLNNKYLLCASPERYLKKTGDNILSQPIKGTIRRGVNPQEDADLIRAFTNSEKDKSENVMVVDMVRNDLSKTCTDVKVSELFGIYTFNKWHHMISSITGNKRKGVHFTEVLKNSFPMGSMTGAPKIRAMQLIEQYESSKRGLYSGAVGYISPNEDFDFNVVIRSILYNAEEKYVSFQTGGAITAVSIPEKEYEECLLKAKAIVEILS